MENGNQEKTDIFRAEETVVFGETAAEETGLENTGSEQAVSKRKKKKEGAGITVFRILITLIIIALGIFLVLWAVAKAAKYETIGSMITHMWGELELMWKRVAA